MERIKKRHLPKGHLYYAIDCYEKRKDVFSHTIILPSCNTKKYRILLNVYNYKIVIDQIKITKKLRLKLETRFNMKMNLGKYDCYFSEYIKIKS